MKGDARPLEGLPLGIKDLYCTKGVRTTFGSPIYRDFVPDTDALLVERLKAAGAVTVGKTNTPEFGAGATGLLTQAPKPRPADHANTAWAADADNL